MLIPLAEPVSPRYIHINPVTNQVHLLVPVVGGQEISTDNTCQAKVALKDFFEGEALRELKAYQEALAFDIQLLSLNAPERDAKIARQIQIKTYIQAVTAMRYSYDTAMTNFLKKPSNLYSIQLCPRDQDLESKVVSPTFNLERTDVSKIPQSALYNALHEMLPDVNITKLDPRDSLITQVLSLLPQNPSFSEIQRMLGEQSVPVFGLAIDFTECKNGTPATKEVIDTLMKFGPEATPQDYIESLLGACAGDVAAMLPTPPFYSIPRATSIDKRTERLSILTQFFLANLNVYCKAKGITTANFGVILDQRNDQSKDKPTNLSKKLVSAVFLALTTGVDVESAIVDFFNDNSQQFRLSRPLTTEDLSAIRQKFERTYRTITGTQENPHMDDFMILDLEAAGEIAKFVTHQGAICVNFAEMIDSTIALLNPDYFASIRTDFITHPSELPPRNEFVAGEVDVDVEFLLTRLNDKQLKYLPPTIKEACHAHSHFGVRHFLHDVAQGKQDKANALLTKTPDRTQILLRTPSLFTDYSGRTFHCTAYEYAYWAKDTHMCRMLESHMDEETKVQMLVRIETLEIKGLSYQQKGKKHQSTHFDLTPLKKALGEYVTCKSNWNVMKTAWMKIGKAQRDVPAHVAHEYCERGRAFHPCPSFNEATLLRNLTFFKRATGNGYSWFPLRTSNSGLGFDFALTREKSLEYALGAPLVSQRTIISQDLEAITHLDEVRTADLGLSREHLSSSTISCGMSL